MFKSLLPWKHMKTKVMVSEQMEDEQIIQEQQLHACKTCGRTFLPLPLKKHAPVCEKNAQKKRKIFDSLKQRVEGTDLAQFHQKSYLKKQEQSTPKSVEKTKRPSQWEESHQKLVETIRSAKGATKEMATKKPQPPVTSTSSHERCPFCERQFGHKAFDRHVEWCKEHRTRVQKSPANVLLAKERLEARTKYKVPPLNKNKKTTIKEKYSSSIINRTDSVCSVKSTPNNAFKREASIRKPRSVMDLGRKVEMPPKIEKSLPNEEKKNKEQNKCLKKRYCPLREKINLTHYENLESITVAPVKLNAKKLVTWRNIPISEPNEESVVVVYENSNVFRKNTSSTKNLNFIEELKELLSDSDDDSKKDPQLSISPKSKSSPEFSQVSSLNFLGINTKIRSVSDGLISVDGDLTQQSSETDLKHSSISDFDEELCLKSMGLDEERSSSDGSLIKRSSEEVCMNEELTPTDLSSNEQLTKLVRSHIEHDISFTDVEEQTVVNDVETTCTQKEIKQDSDFVEDSSVILSSQKSSDQSFSSNYSIDSTKEKELSKKENLNESFYFGKENVALDYEVPKKRRKLNSTFIVDQPQIIKSGIILLPNFDAEKEAPCLSDLGVRSSTYLPARLQQKKKNLQIYKDISGVFLNYQSVASPAPYDPFVSAERQFMELLECDDFKSLNTNTCRPHTAVTDSIKITSKKPVRSAEASNTKKRASVIDPPLCFQDPEDDFELLENMINDQFYLGLNKQNKDEFNVILNKRKYSDDMSSIDSNLINENDNLTIPEHFKLDDYSTTSTEDTDTTLQNSNVDLYSLQYDNKIEPQAENKIKKNVKIKNKSDSSFGGAAIKLKTKTKNVVCQPAQKRIGQSHLKETEKTSPKKNPEEEEGEEITDVTIKPDDLFDVDDKMYAEYKIYEEMYLKEKEHLSNNKKRSKNSVKSYGIEIDQSHNSKTSDDSAYGSLNRATPKSKTMKLSPLQRKRVDSASSSGSENLTNPSLLNNQQRMSKFCHECGNKYPLSTAKFCVECGVKRLIL